MHSLTLLLCLQLLSLQNWSQSFGIQAFSASQNQHPRRSHDKYGFNKGEQKNENDHSDIIKDDKAKKFEEDDSAIDGFDDYVKNLGDYDYASFENGGELKTYDPITDSLVSEVNKDIESKGANIKESHGFRVDSGHHRVDTPHFRNDFVHSYNDSFLTNAASSSIYNTDYFNVHEVYCPVKCKCKDTKVDCAGQNLSSVPEEISPFTTWLDLSMNALQALPDDTFTHMTSLKELRCVGNNLTELPHRLFRCNKFLQLLNFQGNIFSKVPPKAFQNLSYLLELHLDANEITTIPKNAFVGLTSLQQLWLDDNKLNHVPAAALRELPGLQALTLIKNRITHLPDYVFQNNTRLIQLRLANNAITEISDQAFYGLTKLRYLQLQQNKLTAMPSAFSHLISLDELNLEGNLLTEIPEKSFQMKEKLTTLSLENNPITYVADEAFTNLPSLQELKLSEVHDMTKFPDLTGTRNLTVLQLDRANIRSIPENLCVHLKKLKTFDVHSNKIGIIPEMLHCKYLTILNMANNELTSIDGQLFYGMDHLKDLTLSINFIHTITDDTFVGLSALEYLNMAENQISEIHPNAFLPLKSLKDLNLGDNRIHHLPTAGLVSLEKLKVFHNPDLREFPPKEQFPNVNNFVLSYAYHCCDFILSRPEQIYLDMIREHVVWMEAGEPGQLAMWERYENYSRMWEIMTENITTDNDLWESFARSDYDLTKHQRGPYLEDYQNAADEQNYFIAKAAISCKPKPGPFMPCDDLFGWWSLRCGVWFVFMLALLGNGVVFFVSVTSKSKMDVPRFLICNLALADFFMGIYLGILAIIDASTLGHFKKYAIQWQMSAGCLVAGTLGVLSSELSVFTLTVITLERFYAITHAMQLNKRLSLKHAGFIMLCGWIWSFGLAILPLFGISDYRKFAVCLPFEIEDPISKSYVCFIMIFNGISFFIILSCYLIMYISIRDSQAWNSNDTRVAKRMALLVFTDFLCWAPIAFLSLAAAFGKNLIELNEAKVLTIFILPLNSCANPFLYAFFTKQFKKDCVLLCRRLEDSFLAKHFSQVSQRRVSLSWKYQRRPSALNSLMGESKSNNSQNNSSGSNSYGLLNYNSEMSSGINKAAGKEVLKSDKYITQTTLYNASSSSGVNSGRTYHKSTHKYKPCPGCGNEEDNHIIKNTYADISDAEDDDIQVILHQHFYSQGRTGTNGCMVETCFDEDGEQYFFLSSQKSYDDFPADDISIKANGSLQCPSIVIHEDNSTARDEGHIWIKSSQHNTGIELQDRPLQGEDKEHADKEHIPCPEKWRVNNIYNNEKQVNTAKQNNQNCSVDKSNVVVYSTTNKMNEGMNRHVLAKLSMINANNDCLDDHIKNKQEVISDKQKAFEYELKDVLITNACEEKNCKSNKGRWRENLHCCTASTSPVEQKNNLPGHIITESHSSEDETYSK